MSHPDVAIAGIGLATPLGPCTASTWQALLEGRFIAHHARVPVDSNTSRINDLSLRVAHQAIDQAHWDAPDLSSDSTALLVGTSKGAIEQWLETGRFEPFGLGSVAAFLARELRLGRGPRLTLGSACASGLHALIRGVLMIRSGEAQRALVVAAESSLHPLFLACFNRLGVLPRQGVGCRPFDQSRQGFLMSEAAAAICLEPATDRSPMLIGRVALGSDPTHLTSGDPNGLALRRLIKDVIASAPVDLVHAHGTGTLLNDPAELAAIDDALLPATPAPLLYSHKGALGHSLGASGLIAVALSTLMHRHQVVPGNIRTTQPLPASHIRISSSPQQRLIRRSIALAAGFGGSAAALSLTSPL